MNPEEIAKLKAGAANAYDFGYPKTPAQVASTITVDSLTAPAPSALPVPPPPAPNTGYGSAIEQGNTKTAAYNPSTSDISSYKSMFDEIVGAPASNADAYTEAQNSTDILAKQQEVAARKAKLTRAQSELTSIQGEIQSFTEQAKAEERALLKNAEGGLVTSAIFSRQRSKVQEQLAEKVLPYQSKILAKQAEIASLGGDVEQAQQLLSDAKNQLDTLFRLKSEDATNLYNYKKDLFNKAYEFASKAQEQKLREAEKKGDQQFQIEQGNRTAQRSVAEDAWKNGQSDLAARIGQLDPTSPTFQNELARLQGELKQKFEPLITDENGQTVQYQKDANGNVIPGSRTVLGGVGTGGGVGTTPSVVSYYTEQVRSGNLDLSNVPAETRNAVAGELSKGIPPKTFTDEELKTAATSSKELEKKTYEQTIADIEANTTIANKEQAKKIAADVYGKKVETPVFGKGNFAKISIAERAKELSQMQFTSQQIRAQLIQDGYSKNEATSEANKYGGVIDKFTNTISNYLFGE